MLNLDWGQNSKLGVSGPNTPIEYAECMVDYSLIMANFDYRLLMKTITVTGPNYTVKFTVDTHVDTHHRNINNLSTKCMEIMTLQVKWYFPYPAGYLVPYSLFSKNEEISIVSNWMTEAGVDITLPKKIPQIFTLPTTEFLHVYFFFSVSIQLTYKRTAYSLTASTNSIPYNITFTPENVGKQDNLLVALYKTNDWTESPQGHYYTGELQTVVDITGPACVDCEINPEYFDHLHKDKVLLNARLCIDAECDI